MHPRVTALESALGPDGTFAERVEAFRSSGLPRIGVLSNWLGPDGWSMALPVIEQSALDVTHVVHAPMFTLDDSARWDAERDALQRTIDAAVTIDARCVYGTTGSGLPLDFEDAASAFCAAVEPIAGYVRQQSMPLLIEPTILMYADISIVHTLRDTVNLAIAAGLGVCLDVAPCWREPRLRDTIDGAAGQIGLVQLSDFVPGVRAAAQRAVPGDGVVALERYVGWILEAGYAGLFDLELAPEPDVNFAARIRSGSEHVGAMIDRFVAS